MLFYNVPPMKIVNRSNLLPIQFAAVKKKKTFPCEMKVQEVASTFLIQEGAKEYVSTARTRSLYVCKESELKEDGSVKVR